MKLLETSQDFKVLLNKEWLLTIPVFRRLIHRDRGSIGDTDGRKKYRAIKEFTYIYHVCDPRSPLENYEITERMEKALQYAELTSQNIDADVLAAQTEYEELLSFSVPTLELLRAAKESKNQLIVYFRTINFADRDAKGAMVHSPMQHIKNISLLKQLHKDLIEFETLVYNELKDDKMTRGKTELGDKEQGGAKRKWVEATDLPVHDVYSDLEDNPEHLEHLNAAAPSFIKFAAMNEKLDKDFKD